MSKSHWLKDEDQKGNFSNDGQDTFDPGKGYLGVRMQQGVPLLDRDLNEAEDIRRYAEIMLRRHYIGNGTPDETSFEITAVNPQANDFKIAKGRCLVEGFEAVNEPKDVNGDPADFIFYLDQQGVEPLTVPTVNRTDIVYLEVRVKEITSRRNPGDKAEDVDDALNNSQDVNMETSVRHKLEWRVKVDEGNTGHQSQPEDKAFQYDIARIERPANVGTIESSMIVEDLRKTNLSVYNLKDIIDSLTDNVNTHNHSKLVAPDGSPDAALTIDNDGNVGIGTTNPEFKLNVPTGWFRFGPGGDSGRIYVDYSLAPILKLSDLDDPPRIQFQQTGNSDENNPQFSSWIGHAQKKSTDIAIMGGNVGIGTDKPEGRLHLFRYYNDISNPNAPPTAYTDFIVKSGWYGGGSTLVGIGTPKPQATLDVAGEIHAGNSDIYFTKTNHNHSAFGNKAGYAAIENAENYGALMILGRTVSTNPLKRVVKLWDKLEVYGELWASNRTGDPIDYAEYFESKNGKEIKPGTSVALDGGKIRPARKGDSPIGIISANPLIAGGVPIEWPGKYLKDEFGSQIMEEYKEEIMAPNKEKVKKERQKIKKKKIKEKITRTEIVLKKGKYCQEEIEETVEREEEEPVFEEVDLYDATGKNKIGKHQVPVMETYEEEIDVLDENGQPVMKGTGKFETKTRPKLNPKYDEKQEYVSREKRPEWNCVGLLGQLPLRKGQPVADTWVKIKDISKDVELWLVK